MKVNSNNVDISLDSYSITKKLIRNTYALLAMTLLFSSFCAFISIYMNANTVNPLLSFLVMIGVLFLLNKFKIAGSKVNVIVKETKRPSVIIQPKSIIGLIPLNIRDKNAQIVVRTV